MDNRLLLTQSVTLLYRESLIAGKTENSSDLVRTVLEQIKLSELNLTINHEKDILVALKQTALEMCNNPADHQYESGDLLHRLKMNCGMDDKLYDGFVRGIEPELTEASIKRSVINVRKAINNHFRELEINKILNKASFTFNQKRETIKSTNQFIAELCAALEPYQQDVTTKDPGVISDVDVGDEASLNTVFQEIKNTDEGSALMITGFQELNNMLQGGFRRGDNVVTPALQHNFKTGMNLTLFKQLALYNKPYMIDPTKKPLLLRISFEDSIEDNFQFLYQNLKQNETGILPEIKDVSNEEMAKYVKEKLQVNGYHLRFLRVDPTQWTYMHICNKVLELEANGYEVHVLSLDYLSMLPTTGCSIGPMGFDIKDMYKRIRNFTHPRKILLMTPHQLSTESKMLIREGRTDFVKDVAGKGYYAGCRSVDNEVDIEIYQHIEKVNGKAYLTIQRGKHRIPTIIPDEQKYFVLPFTEKGGIMDDIGKPNSASRKLGGGRLNSNEDQTPFWMIE